MSARRQAAIGAAGLEISERRLIGHLTELAGFGGSVAGGVARQSLTPVDLEARRWLAARFATRPGYAVGMDAAANLRIRRWGALADAPVVMTGSHADTQPLGGWLDGAFGVIAGLEVFEALDQAQVRTRHTIEVVAWTNEEGSRFAPGLMGSQSYVQPEALARYLPVRDPQGIRFEQARDAALADFQQAADAGRWQCFAAELAQPVQAYIEAHIEQGPVLEREQHSVGVVHAIQGVRWYQVTVNGRCAHAGTTPLADRDDAQAKAVELANAVYAYARDCGDEALRVTIGRWSCAPDAINTIADQVRFTIDLRHPDPQAMAAFDDVLRAHLAAGVALECLQDKPTTAFAPELVQLLVEAAQQHGIAARSMVSGAFHDAMPLARFAPSAMLFAPSIRGISHHPEENTAAADLSACTQVLASALLRLAIVQS